MPATQTRISHLSAVMVIVEDQDRALDFYVDKLGFEKRADIPFGDGNRWIEVAPAAAQTPISLCIAPEGSRAQPGSMTGIALRTSDIDATHAELKAAGVDVDDEIARYGDPVPPMFWFRDVDGNTLLMVEQ